MTDIQTSVRKAGLTDEDIEAELAAYNAEHRERPAKT